MSMSGPSGFGTDIGFEDHMVMSLGPVHRTRSDIQTAASGSFAAATEWAHSSSILFNAFHGGGPHVQVLLDTVRAVLQHATTVGTK
jgi:hypothetical protein